MSQLLSYLLCAKLSVSLYWCQIVHFLSWCQIVRLPSLCQIMGFYYHSEKFTVPNCPRTIHTPQIVVNYRKFLLWTCETERKEVLCFEHFKLFESVLKRIKKHSKTKYIHCWKDWRRPRPNSLVNAACKQLLCIVHLSHVTHALSLHSYCCGK